ncbi:RNA polymerase sigma factor [Georgenia wutianyii]|uniref:RNA polymerase sigma factor n=1 Tax=Georgenia wutianyii TaxID=2585135 RepID=A0ABX5VR02_9MICO|nr:RNA polymerase sigma factor [Georgenia wutianyii]QDB80872.1 RNA polymerase sigma factor [Georgenia wutianyii]
MTSDGHDAVSDAVTEAFHAEWSQVVATLILRTGDWDLAEDAAQEAFTIAVDRWRREGVPRNPGAWLTTTAYHWAVDRLRREAVGAAKHAEVDRLAGQRAPTVECPEDDRLRLVFTCCHPALALDARVALTLRAVAGLTTAEVARAFLVPEATMSQRLVRAKRKIRQAGIPYRVPPPERLAERTAGVLAVVYLLFTEGHAASSGTSLLRKDLTAEAVRLGRLLLGLLPTDPEVRGLLALMLLHESRRPARTDAAGALVPLERQDRTRWDQDLVVAGTALLEEALAAGRPGTYQVQAAIAACHASAPDAESTDWPQVAALYGMLADLSPSPVVELNRAVAVAMAQGPSAGLRIVDELGTSGALDGYHLLPATRADLLRRLGRDPEARAAYRKALELARTDAERGYLASRLAEVGGPGQNT